MSKVEVRYCSRTKSGNTRRIAEAIAEGAGTKAVSIDYEGALVEKADVLFTTSNWTRRTVVALKKIFKGKGITVSDDYFYAHMLNIDGKLEAAKKFGAENC